MEHKNMFAECIKIYILRLPKYLAIQILVQRAQSIYKCALKQITVNIMDFSNDTSSSSSSSPTPDIRYNSAHIIVQYKVVAAACC